MKTHRKSIKLYCFITLLFLLLIISEAQNISSTALYKYAQNSVFLIEIRGTNSSDVDETLLPSTGFIISSDGYAITNRHVIEEMKRLKSIRYSRIRLGEIDGPKYDFKEVSVDPNFDIALIQLQAPGPFIPLNLGDSGKTGPGERIFAMGFPKGFPFSVSDGIISNLKGPSGMWQTQVPINPGNSGGPVFNTLGQAIAIATMTLRSDLTEGISYITPINQAIYGVIKDKRISYNSNLPDLSTRLSEKIVKGYEFWLVKDDHPVVFDPHSRRYSFDFKAENGYKISDAKTSIYSAAKADNEYIEISPDQHNIKLSITLTSGPAIDRWRGWYMGTLITNQIRE
jgi:Trypsin-like peptidase domain